jgi:hypothetical protein
VKNRNFQDQAVISALIVLGAMAFFLNCHAADFVGDAYYLELAKSIAGKGQYVFNSKPQTMVPPGFPFLLALMTTIVGSSYVVLIRSMVVFSTLSLIAAYEVLRSEEGRHAAAATCLLLGSSPLIFQFSTNLVFSDMPYCFTSMVLLWALMRLDSHKGRIFDQTMWCLLAGALVVISVLMRSTGISLLSGILGWLVVSCFRERHTVKRRIGIFLPLVLAGIIAQAAWMHWAAKHQVSEWPVHGYQEHYLAQIKLKSGNDPELGLATWRDILLRPLHNSDDRAAAVMGLLARKQMAPAWYSPGTVLPLGLILLGLGLSLRRNGGGLLEWYFISYEAMFLFWPWEFEQRFVFPVLPLACLYIWRAGRQLWSFAHDRTRVLGWTFFVMSLVGCLSSCAYGRSVAHPSAWFCVIIWVSIGVASIVLIRSGRTWSRLLSLLEMVTSVRGKPFRVWQLLGTCVTVALVALGLVMQLRLGWSNVHFDLKADGFYPDIEAAEWIKAHSAPSAVIMARKEDLVFHYSQRRVVWFPPLRDPNILMDGIRRYHVLYVIVGGNDTYWRPTTQECFEALSLAYPEDFQLAYQGAHNKVYIVAETGAVRGTL